ELEERLDRARQHVRESAWHQALHEVENVLAVAPNDKAATSLRRTIQRQQKKAQRPGRVLTLKSILANSYTVVAVIGLAVVGGGGAVCARRPPASTATAGGVIPASGELPRRTLTFAPLALSGATSSLRGNTITPPETTLAATSRGSAPVAPVAP